MSTLPPAVLRRLLSDTDGQIRAVHVHLSDVFACMEPGDIYLDDEPPHTIRYRRSEAVIESLRKLHYALLDTQAYLTAELTRAEKGVAA